ncbi:alpha/beta hydrolase [Euzebya sp.]|uniref:alpha/beta hydrolase n=1 Tax=Euzebya sp. TaxID=1971409 RepID=UPI00351906BC
MTGSTSTTAAFTVPVDGGHLAVWSWGPPDGPVVVAAHGITSSHVFWRPVGERLAAEGIRLLAPDLRGRGRSADLPGPSSMARHAEDLMAVLDHAGVEDAVLVGHSMGGFVVATAAVRHPSRAYRVVLVDGGPPLGDDLPADVDVEAALGAIIGPSLARLAERYPDRATYRAFWAGHPSFAAVPPDLVEAYADHDLVPTGEGTWRSCVDRDRVIEDGRDTLTSTALRTAVVDAAAAGTPITFLHAERGMLDGPEGLYPPARVNALLGGQDSIEVRLVADTNHFTIGMSPHGAAAVAAAVAEAVRA